jgi:hypothetical protein
MRIPYNELMTLFARVSSACLVLLFIFSTNFIFPNFVIAALRGNGLISSTVEINSNITNGPSLADSDTYGESITSLGDLNGDGVIDIAVGAIGDDEGGSGRGAVHIHYMNADGTIDSTVEINSSTANGPTLTNGDNYGISIANLGDLNGDGVIDIAVGAHVDDAGGTDRGTIHIHFMNTDGTIDSTVEINSTTTNGPTLTNSDQYGRSVANIGDLNRDGVTDIAVGAIRDDLGGTDSGAIHIHFMNTDGSVDSTVEINSSTTNGPTLTAGDLYGFAIVNLTDLNADGIPELGVTAIRDDQGGTNRGAVHIHYMNTDGSVDSTTEINSSTPNGPTLTDSDEYGRGLANLGDINKDGVADIVVGATGDDEGGTSRGAMHVHFLNNDGTVDSTVETNSSTVNGPSLENSDLYGTTVANIGDLNQDGVIDIAVGADGDDAGGTGRGAVHIHFMASEWYPDPPPVSVHWPSTPDLNSDESRIIAVKDTPVTVIAEAGAFPFGVELEVLEVQKVSPYPQKLFGNYWQIGDSYQMFFKSHFNGAKLSSEFYTGKIPITILKYTELDLYSPGTKNYFSENRIQVAYSTDKRKWQLLPNIVRNGVRNEVAFIRQLDGYFTLVIGNEGSPSTLGAFDSNPVDEKEPEGHIKGANSSSLDIVKKELLGILDWNMF